MGTMMILCDKHVSISVRPNFFYAIVSSVACFVAGHRKLYVGEQRKMDVHCRKLFRRTVGPTAEWTTSLQNHNWNVSQSVSQSGLYAYSAKTLHTVHAHWQQKSTVRV